MRARKRKPVDPRQRTTGRNARPIGLSHGNARPYPNPARLYRRPFPALSLRLYFHWPAGLAYAVGLPWPVGRREAA